MNQLGANAAEQLPYGVNRAKLNLERPDFGQLP
jgi:hypothetical protein